MEFLQNIRVNDRLNRAFIIDYLEEDFLERDAGKTKVCPVQ